MRHLLKRRTSEEQEAWEIESLLDDVAEWRGKTCAEKGEALREVLRLADVIIASSPRGAEMRVWEDLRSPEDEALWYALVETHRRR